MKEFLNWLEAGKPVEKTAMVGMLSALTPELCVYANRYARVISREEFVNGIYIRGLIEITNYCKNNCYYCGLRRHNRNAYRYRLTKVQILEACAAGHELGIETFVLQGGEDPKVDDAFVIDLITAIRHLFPTAAITLSLGEKSREAYKHFFQAGADRYLLRHESASRKHYQCLHPPAMSFDHRINCLFDLKEIGFQTGAGMMIGSPGQTIEDLAEDIMFLCKLRPQMIGLGPYMPQADTPFSAESSGSLEMTLFVLSLLRILLPDTLIPATTALATLDADGYERGILAGANVVMTNLTPRAYREKYVIYDNKRSVQQTPGEEYAELKNRIHNIGYYVVPGRGDFKI